MKKKILLIVSILLLLIFFIAGGGFWYMSTQPLFKPGMVREEINLNAPLDPPLQNPDTNSWLVEPGIELAHFSLGEGPDVLVIHGGPGMPFLQPMSGLEPLTDRFQFHYYDQRGCGESTRPIDRFTSANNYENLTTLNRTLGLGAQIADIERIRRILGDDQLILIGHSWGGFLASLYAAEFPDHVKALVLVTPANTLVMPQPDADSDLFSSVRAGLPENKKAEFDEFMKDYMDFNALFTKSDQELVDLNQRFGEYYMQVVPTFQQGAQAPLPPQGKPGGWMVWGMYLSMGQRHDYRNALKNITVPVLVLHGAEDLQSEEATRLYVDAFPNARLAVIENSGHFIFEEQPEAFARVVTDFLDELK
jgi:proline iminopeptidase